MHCVSVSVKACSLSHSEKLAISRKEFSLLTQVRYEILHVCVCGVCVCVQVVEDTQDSAHDVAVSCSSLSTSSPKRVGCRILQVRGLMIGKTRKILHINHQNACIFSA